MRVQWLCAPAVGCSIVSPLYASIKLGGALVCPLRFCAPPRHGQRTGRPRRALALCGSRSIAARYAGTASSGRPALERGSARPRWALALRGSSSAARRYAGTDSSGRLVFERGRPGRGGPWRCAGRARSPRGTQRRPLRAGSCPRGSWPGRGGPWRCAGRARRPGGTQGRPLRAGSCPRGSRPGRGSPVRMGVGFGTTAGRRSRHSIAQELAAALWRCGNGGNGDLLLPCPLSRQSANGTAPLQRLRITFPLPCLCLYSTPVAAFR